MGVHHQTKSIRNEAAGFARAAIGVGLGFAALVFVLAIAGGMAEEAASPGTLRFENTFESVAPGMHRDEIIRVLGEPNDRTLEFHLGQREGFEAEYAAAAASNSAYFLVWYKGIDTVYSIGFTSDHRVAFKAAGGT